jgi:hypothetical protein
VATCPVGHHSADDDYCDTCGLSMDAARPADVASTARLPPVGDAPAGPDEPSGCVVCRAPLHGGRFCEECGHDNAMPAPDQPPTGWGQEPGPARPAAGEPLGAGEEARGPGGVWTAVVRADRTWYDEVRRRRGPDVDRVEFPRYCPDRRFVLTGGQVAIGRRSRSRGTNPEIDLSGPPLDPGVSAQHALLVASPDGGWELVDLDSTNGTSVGGSARLLTPHTPVRLADGDRIRIGAWTTITVEVVRPGAGRSGSAGQSR